MDERKVDALEVAHEQHLKALRLVLGKGLEALRGMSIESPRDAIRAIGLAVREIRVELGEPSERTASSVEDTIRSEDDDRGKVLGIPAGEPSRDGGYAIERGAREFGSDPSQLNSMLEMLDGYRERSGQPVIALMHEGGAGAGGVEKMVRARRPRA